MIKKKENKVQHVFIIGSKGIPANYGGFESFVEKLTYYKVSPNIFYHVACMSNNNNTFQYNKARCFNIKVPKIGAARAVYYDLAALKASIQYIKENNIKTPIIYVLACRIGPFIGTYKKKIKELGGILYVNPDGHEWMRQKWNRLIKKYWKISERLMVKYSDLLICDSRNIEQYIINNYKKLAPNTIFIAYGAESNQSKLNHDDNKVMDWFKDHEVIPNDYYLIVGRFVPENNYQTIITEFMKSKTKKDLVIITNVENNRFYKQLMRETNFSHDKRIKFVGTVYDHELLMMIRENAFAYIHGHQVGGTNPSLLESLSSTDLNLLYDVCFNREVGDDCALYWNKNDMDLASLINKVDSFSKEERKFYGDKARKRIVAKYSWNNIVNKYESTFLSGL